MRIPYLKFSHYLYIYDDIQLDYIVKECGLEVYRIGRSVGFVWVNIEDGVWAWRV